MPGIVLCMEDMAVSKDNNNKMLVLSFSLSPWSSQSRSGVANPKDSRDQDGDVNE